MDVEQIYRHFSNNRQIIHYRALISRYPPEYFQIISVLNENRWINQSNVSREGVSRAASWPCEPLASS